MPNFKSVLRNVVLPFSKKKPLVTRQNFKKILKNVTKPNLLPPRTKKEDVLVKPVPSLLNLVLKPWKLSSKKLNPLPPQPTTNSKMLKESAKSLKVIWNVSSNEPKNSNQRHVTLKPKSVNKKARLRKLKPSLSRTPKKKTNTKPRLEDFKKNSNWLIPALNSPKDPSTSSNQPSMAFSNPS